MKAYNPSKCPVTRFFTCNAGVFEMICKIILAVLIIPWGSLFLNGVIFEWCLDLVNKGNFWPIFIAAVAVALLAIGIYFSVRAIAGYISGSTRKRVSDNNGGEEPTEEDEEK